VDDRSTDVLGLFPMYTVTAYGEGGPEAATTDREPPAHARADPNAWAFVI
jgi:hypothetical protein